MICPPVCASFGLAPPVGAGLQCEPVFRCQDATPHPNLPDLHGADHPLTVEPGTDPSDEKVARTQKRA